MDKKLEMGSPTGWHLPWMNAQVLMKLVRWVAGGLGGRSLPLQRD